MERQAMILLALVATASAGPMQRVSTPTCSRTCTESSKFSLKPGNTYEYVYRSNVKTTMQGAGTDEAGVIMTATVNLDVLSKCELSMRLSEVKLEELDPVNTPTTDMSAGFARPLEKNPLRVSYQDGLVEHLCPTAAEPTWVMNVKRGIVSMIQNNMDDFAKNKTVTESDVSGECHTTYEVSGSGWYTTTISKTKDLLGCKGRQSYNSALQGIPYSSDSSLQSLPIVKSELTCAHDVDTQSGLLKKVTCKEQHVLRPFSNSAAGAVTINTQELKFLSESRGIKSPAGIYQSAVSLKFEHKNDQSRQKDPARDLKRKLLEVCQKTKTGVQSGTPAMFTDLVYMVRSADADTLSDIYNLVDGKNFCPDNQLRTRKFFLDALPMAGTSGAVRLMTSLITKKTVKDAEANSWITSLAFVKEPTKDMLKEVKPLVNMAGYEAKAMLSVGTLIHNYCQTSGGCTKDYLVTALISAIENQMAKKCKVTPANKKVTLMALRGLGNAGYAMRSVPTLEACMDSPMTEIKLSAIDAFRRMPCDVDRSKMERVYLNKNEDSEIRIAAYRALMQCPSLAVLKVVKTALEHEEVNQVGSYVWTHLTNLMETSDRHKQDIRAILEDEYFKKEFDLDKRKFSRNYEGSFFLDAVNTGAKLEGDVIWSAKSFIPRSSMVNLTVDLFGHSVNLFEMGGRVEGLEYILESLFGPSGYFAQKSMPTTNDATPQALHPRKMKTIDSRFGGKMEDLAGSLYMRVFGNELSYESFDSLQSLLTASDINLLEMLVQLAKDNDYTYSHSSMFLDSSIIIPTSSGFPLNLTVNGTSTVDLRMKGKMDLRTAPHVVVDGLIQPSAAVDISTMMSVDAAVTRPGIKMVSTLHSSTAVQGKLTVKEDGSVTAEYDMPQNKMEIIDVKTSFFTIHKNVERDQPMLTEGRQTVSKCSPRELVTVTGLELCAEMTYPNASQVDTAPYFPFTGPVSAGLYLYKRDTHTKYTMNVKSMHNQDKNVLHLSVDTPGSRTDRHMLADVSLDKAKNTLDMSLKSPWKVANMQGTFTSKKGLTGLVGKMSIDGKKGYMVDAKLVKDRVGNAHRYKPSLDITMPGYSPVSLQGTFVYNGYRQFDVQYSMRGLTASPVMASATIINRPNLMSVKASLELQKDKPYSIDASLSTQETKKKVVYKPLLSVRSPTAEALAFGGTVTHMYEKKIDYNLVLDKIVKKKVTLKGFTSALAKRRGRTIYRTVLKFSSEPADIHWDIKVDNRNYRVIATDLDFTYVIRKVARNNIKLVSKIQNLSSKALRKGKASLNLAVKRNPELNLKLLGNVNHNKKHTDIDLDVRYGANVKDESRHIDMAFEVNRNMKSVMQAQGDIMTRFRFPGMGLNMMVKGDHKHTEQDLDTNLEMRFGKNAPIQTYIRMWERWERQRKLSGEAGLTYPGRQLVLNHTVQETKPDKFTSILNAQTKKGQKSSITTTLDLSKTDNVRVMSDLMISGYTPTHLEGEFQLDPKNFITSFSVSKDSKKYAASLKSETVDFKSTSLTLDLENPSRRVILELDGKKKGDKFLGEADFRWNAMKNNADRVTVKGWLEEPTNEKFNGSLSLSYPSRTLILNAHHVQNNKFSTYADFQWDVNQKISAETVIIAKSGSIIGNGKFTTPFAAVKKIDAELSLNDDSEQYKSDLKLTLNSAKFVSVSTILKKPISLHTFVAIFSSRNNFATIKNLRLDIDHKFSNSLASSSKFSWNRQQVSATVVLQNNSRVGKPSFKGTVDIKTTFKTMKKILVDLSHDNDGKIFKTNAKFLRNKKAYAVTSKITHTRYAHKYENKGKVDVSIPTAKYGTTWSHSHALIAGTIATTYSTNWGKKQQSEITMKFDANYKKSLDLTFKLETPFKAVRSLQLMSGVTMESNSIDGKINIIKDEKVIASSTIGYSIDDDMAKTGMTFEIPQFDVDSSIQAHFDKKDFSASFNAIIMPEMTASLDIKTGLVLWKSTLPGYEQIRFTYEISDRKQLITTETLEYGNGKVFRLQTRLQIDHAEKRVFLELTTPFQQLTKFSAGLNFLGNLESFTSDGFIEFQPVFDKITAEALYNAKDAVSGKLRLDTPFARYPHFQADFNGKLESTKTSAVVEIEYLPRQMVKFELEGELDGSNTRLNTKLLIPDIEISLDHKGNTFSMHSTAAVEVFDKKYELDLDHTMTPKLNTVLTVIVPPRRPVIITISHEGDLLDFKTHAEIQQNRKNNFVSDLSFKATDTYALTSRTTLQSEMISDEEYTVAANYRGVLMQFTGKAELSSKSLGKSTVDVNFGTEREIAGGFAILSPFVKNIRGSFSHFYNLGFLQTKADLVRAGQKVLSLDASLKSDQSVVAEISFTTPITQKLRGLARFDGVKDNFALHTEGSMGTKKADVEYVSRVGSGSLQQTVTVKATGMKDITAELNLIKSSEYKGYAEFKYGTDKHRMDIGFKHLRDIEGNFFLESPLVDTVTASISIQGQPKNFVSQVEFRIGQKKSDVQMIFQMSPKLTGNLKVTSSFIKNIDASFEHSGEIPDFVSKANLMIDNEKYDTKLSVSTKDKLSLSFVLTTPIKEWRLIKTLISHEGGIESFKCHGEYSVGKYRSNIDLSFSSNSVSEGLLTASSHLFPDLSVSFEHSGTMAGFRTNTEVSYDGEKHKSEIQFSNKNTLSAHISVSSPLIDTVECNIEHTWTHPQEITSHADLKVGTDESNADFSLKWSDSSLNSVFSLTSPYSDDMKVTIIHNGLMKNFVSKAVITKGSQEHVGEVSFNLGSNSFVSGVTINSPYSDVTLNLKHGGELKKFAVHGDLSLDGSVRQVDVSMNVLDNAEMTVSVTAPEFSLTLSHNGNLPNFVSSVNLNVKDMETYSTRVSLEMKKDITASLTMASPIKDYESFKATYTHTGTIGDFQCHLEVETPSKSSVSDLIVNEKGATLDVSYPKLKAKIWYDVVLGKELEATTEFSMDDISYTAKLNFVNGSKEMTGGIEMRSTEEGQLKLYGSVTKPTESNQKLSIQLDINEDHSDMEVTFSSSPKISGNVALRTVYFPHVDLNLDVVGPLTNFKTTSEMLINGESKIKIHAELDLEDKQEASLQLETPFTNFTNVNVNSVFQVKSLKDSELSILLIIEDEKLFDADLHLKNDIRSISVYIQPATVAFHLTNEGDVYKATSELTHGSKSIYSVEGRLSNPSRPLNSEGSLTIKPHVLNEFIENEIRAIEISYTMVSTPNAMKSHIETIVNQDKWEADAAASVEKQATEASFSVKAPARDPVRGSVSYKNKFSRYIAHADIELDADTKYNSDVILKMRNGIDGKITITTPIESMRQARLSVTHEGTIPNIKSAVSAKLGDKLASASVDLTQGADSKTTGTVKFASPFESLEKVEATFYHEGKWSNLKAGSKLMYATGKDIEVDVQHILVGTTLNSKVTLKSPFTNEIELSADHTGTWNDFTSSYALTMGADNGIRSDTTFKTGIPYVSLVSNNKVTMTGETHTSTIELKHDGNLEKFRTEGKLQYDDKIMQLDTSFQTKPVIEGSMSLATPFEPVEDVKLSFSHSGGSKAFLTTGEVQYAPQKKVNGKLDVLIHSLSRMSMTAELSTPFLAYENNKVSYQHSGSIANFQCETSVNVASKEFSSTLNGKLSPPNYSLNIKTPFEGYRNIDTKISMDTNDRLGRYSGRLESSWGATNTVISEITISSMHNKIEASATVSSPFAVLSRGSAEVSHQILQGSLKHMLKASLNGKSIVDVETDFNLMTEHKHARVITRAPRPMKYEMEGDFTLKCVDIDATANWNTAEIGKVIKLECGYDIRQDNTANFKITGLGNSIDYKGQFLSRQLSSHLSLDLPVVSGKYGFDMAPSRNGGKVKVMLPTRTLVLDGSIRPKVTEGVFMWDAERDQSKKVEFRSTIVPTQDSVKMDVALTMPSLGKHVKVGSEVVVNRGRVIFEGKTELSYSSDDRQNILFATKLEDVSSGQNKNYSFSFDVSHPYSTVGIKLASHVGKSSDKYSAGMGLEYLTARRQTKTFLVNGMVNKLRKTANFELQSPVKSISIASSLKNEESFQVTLTNVYDRKSPLSTTFTINPAKKSVQFVTNYDLDNPKDSFNVLVQYPDGAHFEAEAYRVVGRARVTDALAALTLNNSRLLHTRLHWRPTILTDLKAYNEKKTMEYNARSLALWAEVERSVLEEGAEKAEFVWDALEKELGSDVMAKVRDALYPVFVDAAKATRDVLATSYESYLMPVKNFASNARLQYAPMEVDDIAARMTDVSNMNFDVLNMLVAESSHKIQRLTRLLPSSRSSSTKWDSYVDVLIAIAKKEIDLALQDLADLNFDWETTVYDPQHGEIQVEVKLPFPVESLDSIPVITPIRTVEKYMKTYKKVVPKKTSLGLGSLAGEWVPPFTGVAKVSAGHQITTFDGYVYDLPIDCTFVLARDYQDGNFSLVLSNDGDTTLTLLSDGPSVQISVTGKVTVSGKELIDLPFSMKDLKIYSVAAETFRIEIADHLTIDYDTSIDHITINMSGWYHGKTGGLLGTYDNEPSNDLMTPFRKVTSNRARFAKTWDVGKSACS